MPRRRSAAAAAAAVVALLVASLLTDWPPLALASGGPEEQGPVFLQEPPHRADFSNSTGVALHCSAHGHPPPRISWLLSDGSEAAAVPGLRRVLDNGTLLLAPFSADQYRPEVHSAAYRCAATNAVGTIVSRRVQVRAVVVKQYYEVQVYDEFVMAGNTAVLRCHVPSFVRDYVVVTSWLRGSADRILTDIQEGGRFSVFPSGELHIRRVAAEDGARAYRCHTAHLLTGHTRLSAVAGRLLVTSPQSAVPPRITDSRSHVTARLRQPVELPCAAQGFPLPTYTWYRSLEGGSRAVALGGRVQQVGGSLYLRAALAEDSGRYVCLANNSAGAERASTSLLVTAPLSAHVVPQRQTADVGGAARLSCSTEGHPQLAVAWLKDGRPLAVDASGRVALPSPRILRIEHVERSDRGMYQCVVSNNEETAQGTAELRLGASSPELVSAFSGAALAAGAAWSAQCEAAGSPLPSVSWLLDGRPLRSSAVPGQHRVEVSVQAGGASVVGQLSLSGVQAADAGVYECVASNAAGQVRHAAALHVLGPPHVRPMRDRRLVARHDAAFHCRVSGYPIQEVRWERDGKILPENHRQQVFPNGTLVIKDVRKHTDEGGYVCVATNPQGQTSRSKMNVQVIEAPEIDPIVIKRDLQLGMRMRLVCVVSKGDFPILIQWLKDGNPIPEDQDVEEKLLDEYSSTLSFSSLAVRHNGNYTCQASNTAASRNYTVEIIVNVPPTWRVEPFDMEVIAGQHVMLACAADGSPEPHIHWMKDTGSLPLQYQDLSNTAMNYKILQNGSLLIQSVEPDDSGYYLCQASNGIDSGLSKVAHLSVHVPARFSTHSTNVSVPKGSIALLNCTVAADKPIFITWYQNDNELKPEQYPKISIKEENTSKGISSTLMLKHVHREDTSSFLCVASNKYGKDQLEVKLIVQEPPEPPINVHIKNFTSRSISLNWQEPYDGNSAIRAYIVQYKNTTAVPWHQNVIQVVVGGDQLNVTIKDLRPAHGYQFQIRAENSVGVSNASEIVMVNTQEEIPEAPPRDIKVKVKDSKTLHVTWRPPDENLQNGEILGYYIGYKISNSSEPFHYKTFEVIPGMELQNTLTELQKFTEYSILVQAYNRAGAGPRSKEVTVTTEEDVPEAPPRDVQCTALSSQRILVLWSSPPESAINGILKGYKVLYRSLADWDDFSHPTEQVTRNSRLELANLGRFCNYSIEVCAFTNKGDGVKSRPVFCRTLEDVPSEPADIKALVMDSRTVVVSWRPPQYPNGRIQKYKVYVKSLDGIGLDKDHFDIPAEQTLYTISHLELHHRYEFWVSAFTAVGEGAGSRHTVQAPATHVPARIASFTQQVIAVLHEDLHLSCHCVGEPAPLRHWKKNEKPIQISNVRINEEWQLYISPVTASDAGNYTCSVENIFGKDEITYYVEVQENKSKGIPPTPSDLQVTSTSISSILLQWNISLAINSLIQGFYLHFKREFGEWEKIVLTAADLSYLLSNLQCGTRYYLYLQTYNQLGQSSPTQTITARTQGSAPVAPSSADFIKVNSTSISLNLTSWNNGGCPITSIVVEYRQKKAMAWTLVSNNIKVEKSEFLVLDLDPETWYTLRITAHNSAGSTAEEYNFITLTYGGATISPDAAEQSVSGDKLFYSALGIIGPTAAGVLVLIGAAIGLFMYLRKKQEMFSSGPLRDKPLEKDLISEADKKTVVPIYDSDDGLVALSPTPQESVYLPTPVRVSPASRKGISPYATFRVPLEGSIKNDENVESCVSSGPVQYPRNVKISEMPDICTESTYSKIQGNMQYDNEGSEWIPLHNLYQAHRY